MAEFAVALVFFGALVYWIFAVAIRDRKGNEQISDARVSQAVLALELFLLIVFLSRIPILRTLPGLILSMPFLYGAHRIIRSNVQKFLQAKVWTDVPKKASANEKSAGAHGAMRKLTAPFARHFYLGLLAVYAFVMGLILLIRYLSSR